MLQNVKNRDLTTKVLDKMVKVPLGVSPMAMQKLAHSDGECGALKGYFL